MSLSTNLALRPRSTAASCQNTSSAPPRPSCQLPIPQQIPESESDNLRSKIFGTDKPFSPQIPSPSPFHVPSLPTASTVRLTSSSRPVHLTLLNPNLSTSTIYTTTNGGYYYTCVLDGDGVIKYSSLAQESVEESLGVVLGLVREDVVVMRWKEKGMGGEEEEGGEMEAEEYGDEEEGEEYNEEGEMEGDGDGYEGEDTNYEEHDEMEMD
jgi:hypothetical protein